MKRHVPVQGHRGVYYSEKQDGSRSYEVRYRDSDGRQRFEVCGPKLQQALDRAAEIRVKKNKGERVAPNKMTLAQCIEEWREHRRGRRGQELAPRTVATYESVLKNHIIPRLGRKQIQKVHTDDIALFIRGLSHGTSVTAYTILSDVLSFASNPRRGYIPFNPCSMLEHGERPSFKPIETRVLTPEETDRLLRHSPDWIRPMVQTALLSGLRAGEVLGLRWQDIDFKENTINVRGQLQRDRTFAATKSGKARAVPLLPALRRVLLEQPSRFSQGYVFQTSLGTPYCHSVLVRGFKRLREKANISVEPRELRFHDLRHTFASALLTEGKDVAWVAEILGHANPAVTMRTYWHVIRREDRSVEAAERLGEALGSWAR